MNILVIITRAKAGYVSYSFDCLMTNSFVSVLLLFCALLHLRKTFDES